MKDVIKIRESRGGKKIVSARELYVILTDNAGNFTRWSTDNIKGNKFAIESFDYQRIMRLAENGRQVEDFDITVDFAKKLCMLSQTKNGDIIREYFLECERLLASSSLPDFNNPAAAARAWADEYEGRKIAEAKLDEVKPKLDTYEAAMNAEGVFTVNEAAKMLQTGEHRLFKFLRENGYFYLDGERNVPYQQHITSGIFTVKFKTYKKGQEEVSYPQSFITPKGIDTLRRKLSGPNQAN